MPHRDFRKNTKTNNFGMSCFPETNFVLHSTISGKSFLKIVACQEFSKVIRLIWRIVLSLRGASSGSESFE